MSGYVEGLLRPAEELLSAAMFGLACLLVMSAPTLFMLPACNERTNAVYAA